MCFKASRLLFLSAVLASCSGQTPSSSGFSSQSESVESLRTYTLVCTDLYHLAGSEYSSSQGASGDGALFWLTDCEYYQSSKLVSFPLAKSHEQVLAFKPGATYRFSIAKDESLYITDSYPYRKVFLSNNGILSFEKVANGYVANANYVNQNIIAKDGKTLETPFEVPDEYLRKTVYDPKEGAFVSINTLKENAEVKVTLSKDVPNAPLFLELI